MEAVHGPGAGGDRAGGEGGLDGVGRSECRDGGNRGSIAGGTFFREVADRRGQRLGEDEEGVAGDGAGELGECVLEVHVNGPLCEVLPDRWELVCLMSRIFSYGLRALSGGQLRVHRTVPISKHSRGEIADDRLGWRADVGV